MRSFVPAIYDCTVAVPRNQDPPTMLRIFRAQSSVVGRQNTFDSFIYHPNIYQWYCKQLINESEL